MKKTLLSGGIALFSLSCSNADDTASFDNSDTSSQTVQNGNPTGTPPDKFAYGYNH
ncbi:MAG: hypothetical protein MUW56_09940 [Chryseobacterium sp.]|uniref:hypothetical protein n=1 Tax=Chryseobacterium sp. TaxID=1871047 RepID=UPI0025C4C8DA|nr:hypothetical protein [Chryseobacterium sp.]MCJ7933933.1 hypothetical protein [Chryseobacterium sp.]